MPEIRHAGQTPTSKLVPSAMAAAKPSAAKSRCASWKRGTFSGLSATKTSIAQTAKRSATAPPSKPSRALSVSTWLINRHRPAPQRGAYCQFFLSRRRPGELQVGDVRASDQKHATHRCHEQVEAAAVVSYRGGQQRQGVDRQTCVGVRVASAQFGGNPVEVLIGLHRRDAGLESAERIKIGAIIALVEKRVFAQVAQWDVQFGRAWKAHCWRQDADDLARHPARHDALTQNCR